MEGHEKHYISYRMVGNEPVKVYMYGQDGGKFCIIWVKTTI